MTPQERAHKMPLHWMPIDSNCVHSIVDIHKQVAEITNTIASAERDATASITEELTATLGAITDLQARFDKLERATLAEVSISMLAEMDRLRALVPTTGISDAIDEEKIRETAREIGEQMRTSGFITFPQFSQPTRLIVGGVEVPNHQFHRYSIRWSVVCPDPTYAAIAILYVDGKRTVMPWSLVANLESRGGGDVSA